MNHGTFNRKIVRGSALAIFATASLPAAAQAQRFIAGPFNGWNPAGQAMVANADGTYSATVEGLDPNTRYEFKVTVGTWDQSWPGANSWFISDAAGKIDINYDPTTQTDGWAPGANRINVSTDPGTWTAVGNWQGWSNGNPATAMTALGGGLYLYEATIAAPATNEFKATNTGTWDALGSDSITINAGTWSFTTTVADERRNLWANTSDGSIKVTQVYNYTGATDSTWSTAGNWSSGATPNGGDDVYFDAVIPGTGSTVTVDAGSAASSMFFNGSYTLSGGDIALAGGVVNTAADTLTTISSTLTGGAALNKVGPGTLVLTGNNTYTAGTNVHAGTLKVTRLHEDNAVNITGGTVQILESSPGYSTGHPAGDNASVSVPSSLSIAPGATLDITNNDVVIDYTGASPLAAYEALVASGFNVTGDWQGDGIVSSIAANDGNYVVAIADNATLAAPFGTAQGGPLFAGVDVDLDTILIKFTHRADINLDGVITPDDSAIFGGNYDENQPATWATGDMNYDGIFTPDDAAIFGGAYDESLASLPEPASLSTLALGLTALRRKRR